MTQVPATGSIRTPWLARTAAGSSRPCASPAEAVPGGEVSGDRADLGTSRPDVPTPPLPLLAARGAEQAAEEPSLRGWRKAGSILIGAVSMLGALGTATPALAAEAAGTSISASIHHQGQVAEGPTAGTARAEASVPPDSTRVRTAAPTVEGSKPESAPADSTRLPEADPRTARTDDFLQDWTEGLFDQRLPLGDRMGRSMVREGLKSMSFPYQEGNGSTAPPLGSLQGIRSFDDLRARVDGHAGAQGRSFNQVAMDMGARYGGQNYAYGAGGSIPSDINAFNLFNDGKGVCVEIHSAVAAYRSAHGQEAYVVGSSATGNAHAFTVFKDNGRWYIQNYGRVIETDARNLRDLFDRALPEEVRPQLLRPQADGSMQTVGRGFVTGTGMASRRFSEIAGGGAFDPFIEQGAFAAFKDGSLTYSNGRTYVVADPFSGELNVGHNYRVERDGSSETVAGFAGRIGLEGQQIDGKWETETRWLTGNHWGRSRFAVFGGAELDGASPQYWENEPARRTMHLGASYQRNESWLHGQGDLKLETGYDAHLRGVWTYGLDGATRNAATQSQNGGSALYLGDESRMIGDAQASAGVNVGGVYTPAPGTMLRAGVRVGEDLASFGSMNLGTGLRNGFQPSVYAEGQWRPGHGIVAGGALQVPLNGGGDYRLISAVGYSPSERFTIGCTYDRERFVGETTDRIRAGVGWAPHRNIEVTAGVETQGFAKDNSPRTVSAIGGVRIRL